MSWLTGYQYRKPITISGSAGAGAGYQVLLKVGESEGSSDAHFHLEGHALNFPNDIRFTASDGVTELAYWLEKVEGTAPNRTAYFWVKVNESLDNDVDIYCYYGKEGDVSASNGEETFEFFDHFENLDKWTAMDGNCGSITDSKLVIENKTACRYTSPISIQDDVVCEVYGKDYILNNDAELGLHLVDTDSQKEWGSFLNTKLNITLGRKSTSSLALDWSEKTSISNTVPPVSGIVQLFVKGQTLKAKWIGDDGEVRETPSHLDNAFNKSYIDEIKVGIHSGSAGSAEWDWILIRKYTEPEPAFSSAGAEEVAGGVASISSAIADAYSIYVYSSNSAQDSYKLLNFASELLDEVYAILKFVDNSASDEYIILNFVSNLVSDKYKLMNFGGQNIKENYAILAFTSGRFSDIYNILGFVSNVILDEYKIFSFIFSSISDSYFISGLISTILTDTYKLLNFRSSGIFDSYTIFKQLSKLVQDEYSIFKFGSNLISDEYKIFVFLAKSFNDYYKIWEFTTTRLTDFYSIFKRLSKPIQDEYSVYRFGKNLISEEYKILVFLTKSLDDIYDIREFTAVQLTEDYAILKQIIVRKIVTLSSSIDKTVLLKSKLI